MLILRVRLFEYLVEGLLIISRDKFICRVNTWLLSYDKAFLRVSSDFLQLMNNPLLCILLFL